ncbi:hypothetical protein CANINC_003135 [Pichia inconspicua]|uniref:Nucleoporin Nup82 n=1 Tax=Pichia inconspicua TaxID=52247 RepID=A0A4T0WZF2_9ASCO|nr:hypothetical protein CANINC_003135 [[Candida] inconspicua]
MVFKDAIEKHSYAFYHSKPFRTLTRKHGSEIITVSDGKIILTVLGLPEGDNRSTIELASDLTFDPIEIVMNESEQLLCVYDNKNIWVYTLNEEGSLIDHTIKYKINLFLESDDHILQVIFNNVSKYQSEIVALTTKKIMAYDINQSSLHRVIPFSMATIFDAFDCQVIDPVSICFASAYTEGTKNNPQNDLTLLLLTSDASLYKIYPFFPNELCVSRQWLTDLFDSTTMVFNSIEDEQIQTEFMDSLEITALLYKAEDPQSIRVKSLIPRNLREAKIAGPICIEIFPDELYSYNATKILPFPNDIIAVVFDQAIVLFSRAVSLKMICSKKIETDESIQLLETIFINSEQGSILTANIHPVTFDSLFVLASNGAILQLDFSLWMSSLTKGLETGDLSEFIELCQNERLPTDVINLGKTNIIEEKKSLVSYHVRSRENNLFFAWSTTDVYCMYAKQGKNDVVTVVQVSSTTDTGVDEDDKTQDTKDSSDTRKYRSLLVGTFDVEVLPQLQKSLAKIAELNQLVRKLPTTIIDEKKATVDDLKLTHQLVDLISTGQLILYKTVTLLSNRLKMMVLEYQNQINTYHQVLLKKDRILKNFLKLKATYSKICDKQDQLLVRLANAVKNTEILESKSNSKSLSISYQENAYFKELARMKDFVLRQESELQSLTDLLNDVKNAETSIINSRRLEVINSSGSKRTIESLKRQLEEQGVFISHLSDKLRALTIS